MAVTRAAGPVFAAAQHQHGVVTTTQLLAAGWDKDVIARRVARGYLRRLHHGVYLAGPLEAEHTAAMAAVLATGGVVSHYPAAVLWDWRPPREGPMHVIARGRNQPGLVVHHTALDPRDITRRHGIPHLRRSDHPRPRRHRTHRRARPRAQRGGTPAARQPSFPQ